MTSTPRSAAEESLNGKSMTYFVVILTQYYVNLLKFNNKLMFCLKQQNIYLCYLTIRLTQLKY